MTKVLMLSRCVTVAGLAAAIALGCGSDPEGHASGTGGDSTTGGVATGTGGTGNGAVPASGGSATAAQGGMPGALGGTLAGGAVGFGGSGSGVGGEPPAASGGMQSGAGGIGTGGLGLGGAPGSGGATTGGTPGSGGAAAGGAAGFGGAAAGGVSTGGAAGGTGAIDTGTGGKLGSGGTLDETGGSAGIPPETGGGAGTGGRGTDGGGSECPSSGDITYILNQSESPSDDELDAYEHLTAAMDEAVRYYNCYTDLEKQLWVNYNPGVPTAEANIDGWMSFGSNRAYMVVATAMHEIAHTLGIGYYTFGEMTDSNGIWTGANANAVLASISNPRDTELHADAMHFWPYGLNYASEHENEDDLVNHCLLVTAIRQDMGL